MTRKLIFPPRHAAEFALLASALLVSACEGSGTAPRVCTLIGCSSGTRIILENRPTQSYRIEVFSGSSTGPKYGFQCDNPISCGDAFFPDFTPYRVFVDVILGSSQERYEVIPNYTESRPNGAGCDPLCRQATIRVPSDRLR